MKSPTVVSLGSIARADARDMPQTAGLQLSVTVALADESR